MPLAGSIRIACRAQDAATCPPPLAVDIPEEAATYDFEGYAVFAKHDGARLTLELESRVPLRIDCVNVRVEGTFSSFDKVLFNGYQTWTDTHEMAASSIQRGLQGMPRALINHYCLDGSGDYRFYRYAARPGFLHGWTYVYFRRLNTVRLIASLNEERGFTLFEWEGGDWISITPEAPERTIEPGERVLLADLVFIEATDEACADTAIDVAHEIWFGIKRSAYGYQPRINRPLTGYSSWYRHYDDISETKIFSDLIATERVFGMLDTTGFSRLFQIDDGYARVGDWLSIDKCKFPQGLKPVSQRIERAGFVPGLWMAPFVCERESRLFAEHPDWIMRDGEGEPIRTGGHWSGGVALDTRNPEVRTYIIECLQTATHDWGFRLLKLDFLYAACMVCHDGLNRGELMADALRLVREAVGPNVLLDLCGVPLASAFGIADFCRIGCDVGLDWDSTFVMRMTERERVSTKNSLGNTVYRAPLDGRAFGNDPDVVLMRADVDYTPEQREMVLFGAATCASMLLTSDDPTSWTIAQLDRFQEALDLMRARHEGRL